MNDMKLVQANGLEQKFYEDHKHSRDPMWAMVQRHMEVTLGSRLMDSAALSGDVAWETAIAHSLGAVRNNSSHADGICCDTSPGKLHGQSWFPRMDRSAPRQLSKDSALLC